MRALLFLCAASLLAQTAKDWYDRGRQYSELSSRAFERLMKLAPESGYVLALLGEVKTKEHQYTAALYAYNESAKRTPRLRGVHSAIADIDVAIGKTGEADAARASEARLGPPNCATEKLYCDFAAGRFDEVVKAAKLKTGAEALYWQARAYNELAVQALSRLGNLPDSPELHQVKAQILRDQGQFRESAEEWRAVLAASPGDVNARHELATSLYLSHDYKTTLPELQQFLDAEPDSANLNFFVGDSLLQTEQVEQAVPYLEKAVKFDPKLAPAHAALGLCYGRLGQWQKAIPHLRTALPLDRDGSVHYQLARAYNATGQPALAKPMMDKYQQLRKSAAPSAPAP